jgi:hypothetical protein
MSSDVKLSTITSTGTVRAGPCRVKKVSWVTTASAGVIVLKDGGSGGATLATINTAIAAGFNEFDFGECGILFRTDCHATLTNITSLMVVYDG